MDLQAFWDEMLLSPHLKLPLILLTKKHGASNSSLSLFLSASRGCQPPQSVHATASAAPSAQPPHLIPPVCQQPEQKHPEGRTQPHPRSSAGHRRRADHPGVGPAARQLGPQQQRPTGDQVRGDVGLSSAVDMFTRG